MEKRNEINDEQIDMLIKEAVHETTLSYAPYSNYYVGAAILTEDGKIFGGCNIENAAYPASNCAERTAIFKAVSEGNRNFKAIAIVGGPKGELKDFAPPCGVCRQVMMEFCKPDFKIILYKEGETKIYTLEELLPLGFGGDKLG